MSVFFVDSTTELVGDQIKKLGVESFELPFLFDGQEMSMDEEFDCDKFYSKCKKGIKINPCVPNKNVYLDAFEPVLKQNDDIIYVHQSSNIFDISTLIDAKEQLLKDYPNARIELVDSASFSIGYGIIAYLLALKYRNGATIDEILDYAFEIQKEFSTYFLLDNLEKLEENKCISESNIASSALSIKPIVNIDKHGKFNVYHKTSGKKKAIAELINIVRQTGENVADFPIGIVYNTNFVEAEEVKDKLLDFFGEDITILIQKITPANASVLGVGVLGITFHSHKNF